MATSNATTTQQDPAQQILAGASGLDDKARADAWEAFHGAKDQGELTTRLKGMNLPGTVAADLWEAKRGAGADGITPETMQTRSQQQAQEAVRRPLTQAVQRREQAQETLHAPMPGSFEGHPENVGEYIPRVVNPAVSGVKDIAHGNISRGLHEGVSSISNAALPALPFVAAGAPLAAAGAAVGGGAGDIAARKVAQFAGATPDQTDLAGDIGGFVGGGVGSKIPKVGDFLIERPRSILPSAEKAGNLFQRAVAPGGMTQEDERPFGEMVKTLQKYIPQYAKATPLEAGAGGATRAADMVQQAKQNLWDENVAPVIHNYAHVQAPVESAGKAALETVGTASQATPEQVRATRQFADQFSRGPWTVQKMADTITELNNDKSILSFENADAEKQSQMLLSNPALRGKIAALRDLKQNLFDTVANNGGESLGADFEQARRDWGKLSEAGDWIRNTKIPTKIPLVNRAMNSVRGVLTPRSMDFWLHPSETLLGTNNPNRLLPKAFNTMAQVGAESPAAVGRTSPVTLPSRMLPRVGESTLPESNPTLGTQAPGGPATEIPRVITLNGEQPSTALARIPGSTPMTHIPSSQYGHSLREFTMPRVEFEQSAQRALPPAKLEDIAPASSGNYRTAGVVRLGPEAKVAAPEPQAWSSEKEMPTVPRSIGEIQREQMPKVEIPSQPRRGTTRERSLDEAERLRRRNAGK